jgi:ATP synthase protein I
MTRSDPDNQTPAGSAMPQIVGRKQQRRLEARRRPERNIWFGLGMFGLVGWAIAVPTLIGVAVGAWIDHRWPSRYSWTLMLMLLGVAVGCLHAWQWVHRESELDEPPVSPPHRDQQAKGRP